MSSGMVSLSSICTRTRDTFRFRPTLGQVAQGEEIGPRSLRMLSGGALSLPASMR